MLPTWVLLHPCSIIHVDAGRMKATELISAGVGIYHKRAPDHPLLSAQFSVHRVKVTTAVMESDNLAASPPFDRSGGEGLAARLGE